MAASPSTLPGETSRRCATRSRVSHSSRTTAICRRRRTLCIPEVRRQGSLRGGGGRRGGDGVELLPGPVQLALPVQLLLQRVAQVDEQFHVQRRVAQPGFGQRAGRPVDRRVALLQDEAEDALDHRAEAHPGEPGEPSGQLGVEEAGGDHAYLAQARQVLGGGVQHPLGAGDAPRRGPRGRGRRRGRSGRCPRPRGAAAPGRRAGRSGSRTRARRRRRPGRCPRRRRRSPRRAPRRRRSPAGCPRGAPARGSAPVRRRPEGAPPVVRSEMSAAVSWASVTCQGYPCMDSARRRNVPSTGAGGS